MEIGSLPNKEFKVMIIKMIKELGRRIDEQSEKFNKAVEDTKKNQTELKNTMTGIKNTMRAINRRSDWAEQISELEDRVMENTEAEQKKE